MKTEQEQRRAIRQILFDANDICQATPCENEYCIYHGDYRCYDNVIIDKLIRAGYGDVSEYKAEREMLGSQIKVLKQRLNDKYIEIDNLNRDYSNSFERLKAQGREITRLKAEVKQAQIDVLNKAKEYISNNADFYYKSECGEYAAVNITSFEKYIDELIKEIER